MGAKMKKSVTFLMLSIMPFIQTYAEVYCVEKVECKTYSDGKSAFNDPLVSDRAHDISAAIPDLVYIRLIVRGEKNGVEVREVANKEHTPWSMKIKSNALSLSSEKSHIDSLNANLQRAKRLCEQKKDEIIFTYDDCRNYSQRDGR